MKIFLLFIILVVSTLFFNACSPGYVASEPTALVVVRPASPRAGYIWRDGDWSYNRRQRVYVQKNGYWTAPRRNRSYHPGHWNASPRGHSWKKGGWR